MQGVPLDGLVTAADLAGQFQSLLADIKSQLEIAQDGMMESDMAFRAYQDAAESLTPQGESLPVAANGPGTFYDGQSQPSWPNRPSRSLTARISVTLPRSRVKIQICSTSKRRPVG